MTDSSVDEVLAGAAFAVCASSCNLQW